MELTNAAVHDRIADLNALAAELRIARETHGTHVTHPTPSQARPVDRHPAGPAGRLGDWLIGLGTTLGGDPLAARRDVLR